MNSEFDNLALSGGSPVVPGETPGWPDAGLNIAAVFQELQQSGAWGKYHADFTGRLEDLLRRSIGLEHVILSSSGTSAVELALRGLKVGEGDEVILAAYDFKANFTNVSLLGAQPLLVDIRSEDGQLDVAAVENAISEKTRAVIASHLHGGMVEMQRLRNVADAHQIAIIEDCCQLSPHARIDGRVVGQSGDVAVFSFGGSKLFTSGRGGALLTDRADIAQRVRLFMNRGNVAYPLSEMQAAVLIPQFDRLPELAGTRTQAVDAIRCQVKDDSGLRPFPVASNNVPDFYKLGFWYDSEVFGGISRESFCSAMRAEGIPIDPGFGALHRIHSRSRFRKAGDLMTADRAHDSLVVLHHPFLLWGPVAAEYFLQGVDKIKRFATILRD